MTKKIKKIRKIKKDNPPKRIKLRKFLNSKEKIIWNPNNKDGQNNE